jgi:hypothetical protein
MMPVLQIRGKAATSIGRIITKNKKLNTDEVRGKDFVY